MARQRRSDGPPQARPENDRQFVKALARGLDLLAVFRAEDRGLTNGELVARTGFAKATVSRLTHTLVVLGYLKLDEDTGRYWLHPHILTLGYPALGQLPIREMARPLMQELADRSRSAVSLAIRDGLTMIVVGRARHQSMMMVPVDIGVAREIATSSSGRAYIAALRDEARAALLEEIRASEEQRWPAVAAGIEEALRSYRENGYTLSAGDWLPDYNAVGVPLRLADGRIVAFACGGVANRVTPELLPVLGEQLVEMVQALARTQDLDR